MPVFKGRWTARVEQDFEVEADDEDEARDWIEGEMELRNVVELIDIEIDSIREA